MKGGNKTENNKKGEGGGKERIRKEGVRQKKEKMENDKWEGEG